MTKQMLSKIDNPRSFSISTEKWDARASTRYWVRFKFGLDKSGRERQPEIQLCFTFDEAVEEGRAHLRGNR